MKKIILILTISLITLISVAQPKKPCKLERVDKTTHVSGTVERSSFFENWYLGLNGGVFTPFGQHVSPFSEARGVAGLELGKNITPVFGLSVDGYGIFNNTMSYGNTAIQFTNVVGNMKFNLSNWFGGYKGYPRTCEVSAVPGIGWMHQYGENVITNNFLTYNAGVQVDFNFGKKKQWQFNIKPTYVWFTGTPYNNHNFNFNYSGLTCRFGFTYKFGKKGSHNFRTCNHVITQEEYDKVYNEYEKLLHRPMPQPKVIEKIVTVKEPADKVNIPELLVTFKIGTSNLTNLEKERIINYIEQLPKGVVVNVLGSADSGTGSKKINEKLSKERANEVVVLLKELGIKVNTIETELDTFELPEASRNAVIIVTEK